MTDIKLQNTDKNFIIIKTEMQLYEREVVILLNIVLNFKSKNIKKTYSEKVFRKILHMPYVYDPLA